MDFEKIDEEYADIPTDKLERICNLKLVEDLNQLSNQIYTVNYSAMWALARRLLKEDKAVLVDSEHKIQVYPIKDLEKKLREHAEKTKGRIYTNTLFPPALYSMYVDKIFEGRSNEDIVKTLEEVASQLGEEERLWSHPQSCLESDCLTDRLRQEDKSFDLSEDGKVLIYDLVDVEPIKVIAHGMMWFDEDDDYTPDASTIELNKLAILAGEPGDEGLDTREIELGLDSENRFILDTWYGMEAEEFEPTTTRYRYESGSWVKIGSWPNKTIKPQEGSSVYFILE